MTKHAVLAMAFLMACGGDDGGGDDTGAAAAGDTFKGAPLAELSDGECPKFEKSGTKKFSSNGIQREVIVLFPEDKPANMPVFFYWYGLGDRASNIESGLRMQDLADEMGAVIVIPESTDPNMITWDFMADGGSDVVLYDDMRTCLSQELDIDLNRISTGGVSFGGLWATYLTLQRGDTLSAAVSMSGGTDALLQMPYVTPAAQVPVLVMWGGTNDNYSFGAVTVDFQNNSKTFSDGLQGDGHFVVECDHGLGHAVPSNFMDIMVPFAFDHVYGEPSPYAGGLSGFPDFCTIP